MVKVKICGITSVDDALAAVEFGADALGFNFYQESPRYIDPRQAAEISLELPPNVWKVGVFADAPGEVVKEVHQMVGLDFLQFHGNETPYYCEQFSMPYWKAFRIKDSHTIELMAKYRPYAYLIDAYREGMLGGTGVTVDWSLAMKAKKYGKIILAGGLSPENVVAAVESVQPWAVDACSSIELRPGIKDHERMSELIKRVKGMEQA